jgi:hypothetical protein
METTYYIQHCISDLQENTVQSTDSLKKAADYFQYYCELHPKEKYKIIKRQIIDEIVAESTDFRQKTFEFA